MSYQNYSYRRDEGKSRTPMVVLTIVLVVIVVAAIFLAMHFLAPSNVAGESSQTRFDEVSSTPAEQAVMAEDVIMTLGGSGDTYVLVGEEYLESGCHAVQSGFGDITSSVITEGSVDTSTPGTYEITYTATTSEGTKAKQIRRVHVTESFDANAASIPVFMYHYVYDAANPPAHLDNNYILNTKLAEQCAYLKDNDYYFPSYEELRAFVDGAHTLPAKSAILTFDDGEIGFLQTGIPVLEEFEVPATSFVVAKDAAQNVIDYASPYVSFQSHTYNMHRAGGGKGQGGIIYSYTHDEILDDIAKSNEVTGADGAVALAYPFGDNDENAQAALGESGIICAFTVKNARISPGDNPLALNRVRISGEYTLDSFKALCAADPV